jgi:Ca-activated chloride channel family protein
MRTFAAATLLCLPLLVSPLRSVPTAARQDVSIQGRTIDAATGAPLAGVQVFVASTPRGTISDAQGRYRLTVPAALRGRRVQVRATLIGYEPARKAVRLQAEAVTLDFALAPAAIALESVVVTGQDAAARVRQAAPSVAAAEVQGRFRSVPIAPAHAEPTGAAHHRHPDWNTEAYDRIYENPFLAVGPNPLSTFSIDVDRASYSNIRRFINQGQQPPRDAVRIEEMINYFPYDYPAPRGEHPFSVTTEVANAPWNPARKLVRIGLQGKQIELRNAPPSNLVFLIDVSGSMQPADRLPLLKSAFRLLVNELREQDRVAIVVYAGAAGLVLPSTPGDQKETILDAIEALEAGGSTAGGAGIRLAYDVARANHIRGGNNRVILATDGDFNVGVSSDAEMVRLIEEKREQGTFLTVLGFGTGNLKDSKMEKLADKGNGQYAYIDGLLEARKMLVSEIGGTLLTIAKDVKLQLEFNPTKVAAYRLIGYENRLLRDEDFDDDSKDAGEMGAGHSVTALYEIIPVGIDSPVKVRGIDSLRYQRPTAQRTAAAGEELLFVKLRYKQPDGNTSQLLQHPVLDRPGRVSDDFTFTTAVAAFGLLLRDSEYKGNATLSEVIAMAKRSKGRDEEGYRAEFIRLAESMQRLGLNHTDERNGQR